MKSSGGELCPQLSAPQHKTDPSTSMPQLWPDPEDIWRKIASGGVDSPELFAPQQEAKPSVFTAQLCSEPAETCAKTPGGACN